ncbi:MAG: hypothetical protein HY866_19195, partial [Chloroflexi bacterium]|nr:hypothetical protein [Chloroflexota bacterium]
MRVRLLFFAVLLLIAAALISFPAAAFPALQQTPMLPTPTLFPVQDVTYTLSWVGGAPQPLLFSYTDANGAMLGRSTVESRYPRGLVFSLMLERAPESVTLMARYDSGIGTRVEATWNQDGNAWIASLWETGGFPAWVHLTFFWRVAFADGTVIETEAYPVDYADPTRQWFRAENEQMVIYWFGVGEDEPDRVARALLESVAAARASLRQGFGADLSYRPMTIIYDSRDAVREIYGSETATRGFASYDLGVSLLAAPHGAGVEAEIGWLTFTVAHEMVHLYQFDVIGGIID